MVLFEIIEQVFMPHQQTQSVSWYYVVTLILLCLSGAVAALNRRYDHARRERDAAYVRDVTLKTNIKTRSVLSVGCTPEWFERFQIFSI